MTISNAPKTTITLKTLVKQMLKGWWWLVICMAVAFALLKFLSGNTVLSTAEYKLSVMTRFPSKGDKHVLQTNSNSDFLWEKLPAYDVRTVYGILLSSEIIERAGNKVGYNVDYSQKSLLRTYDVYNDMPMKLMFPDMFDNDELQLTVNYDKSSNSFRVAAASGTYKGVSLSENNALVGARLVPGDTLQSPVGRIICLSMVNNGKYSKTSLDLSKPVIINKINNNSAKTRFDSDLILTVEYDNTLLMKMSVAGSPRRVIEVMTGIIDECQTQLKSLLRKDIDEDERLIKSALNSPSLLNLEPAVQQKERMLLQEKLAKCEANKQTLALNDVLLVTDPPAMRPAPSATSYLKLVLLILGVTVFLLIIYYTKIRTGRVLDPTQLNSFLQNQMLGKYTYCNTKQQNKKEAILYKLDAVRLQYQNTQQLTILSSDDDKYTQWFTELFIENLKLSGKAVKHIHLSTQKQHNMPNCEVHTIAPGTIGCDTFHKDITEKISSITPNTMVIITAEKKLFNALLPIQKEILLLLVEDNTYIKKVNKLTEEALKVQPFNGTSLHTMWIETPIFKS